MIYCEKHIPLDGCIPGDEVMSRRDDECPVCVREERDRLRVGDADMLNAIDDWRLRAGVAEAEVKMLREIIRNEGKKWIAYHTDPEKKKYWATFSMKAGRPE